MPQATTILSTIRDRCQNRVSDITTDIWTATADGGDWSNAINDTTKEILADIIRCNAIELCDKIQDSTAIIMVDEQEEYDYVTAITGDSKTYFHFISAKWGDYKVRVLPWYRYHELLSGYIPHSLYRPYMIFFGSDEFKLRPVPTGSSPTFTFYYLKPPTTLDADDEKPDLDERCIPLYYPKVAAKYWLRRNRYERYQAEEMNYERLVKKIIYPFKRYKIRNVISLENG